MNIPNDMSLKATKIKDLEKIIYSHFETKSKDEKYMDENDEKHALTQTNTRLKRFS